VFINQPALLTVGDTKITSLCRACPARMARTVSSTVAPGPVVGGPRPCMRLLGDDPDVLESASR
jgi:hypothetical protein